MKEIKKKKKRLIGIIAVLFFTVIFFTGCDGLLNSLSGSSFKGGTYFLTPQFLMIFNGTKTGTVTYKIFSEKDSSETPYVYYYAAVAEGTYEASEDEITATLTGVSNLMQETKTFTFYTTND